MRTHKLYLYTTENYQKIRWYKPGQTSKDVAERIDEQDGTACPEPLYQLAELTVPFYITDIKVREWLHENRGWTRTRLDKLREWRKVPKGQNALEDWKAAINALQFGVARPHAYSMREEQKACHDKAVKYFKKKGKKFLINAKMRFGKTFVCYQIAKTLGCRKILVITYKPSTKDGWKSDLEQHVHFEGWRYLYARDFDASNPIQLPNNCPVVLFASFQDFNVEEKAKWKFAENYNYDLVIIDEQHHGSDTKKARKSLARIRHNKEIHVSGTPLDALMSGKFLDDQIYTWGYADEQAKRREEQKKGWKTEIYRWLPPMTLHTFDICDEAKRMVAAYNPDEGFSMTKMFASDDGIKLNDEASVQLFIDQVFGIGVRKTKSPYRTFAPNHSLWLLPRSIKSVNAFANFLRKRIGNDYHIINVAGDNVTQLKHAKEAIEFYKKTITLTCGRFVTGVTVPEWDAVLMLDDTQSPETYFQTIFRCQNPDQSRRKEECHVFDFNPQRCLEMTYAFVEVTRRKDQTIQNAIRQFLDYAPILDHSNNQPVIVDVDIILNMIAETGGYAESFGSDANVDWSMIDINSDIYKLVKFEKNIKLAKQVSDNGLQKGRNFQPGNRKAFDKKYDKYREFKERVISTLRRIPTYLYINRKIKSIQNIFTLSTNDAKVFRDIVQISHKDFHKEVERGFFNKDQLDRRIVAFTQIERM